MERVELHGNQSECQVCFRIFNTSKGFDKHRAGGFGKDDKRICLSESEMLKKGMIMRVREKDAVEIWYIQEQDPAARARLDAASERMRLAKLAKQSNV